MSSFSNQNDPKRDLNFRAHSLFVSFIVFLISLVLCNYYVGGDQHAYIKVYNMMPNLGLFEAQKYYQKYLTSRELVHFIFIFIFSRIFEKAVFISIINSIFAYAVLALFRKLGANFFISSVILLTNYYAYVLFVPAERLKFGIILFILSVLFINSLKKSLLFSFLSCFAHFQVILLYASIIFRSQLSKFLILIYEFKLSWQLIAILIFPLIFFYIFNDAILHKVNVAMSHSNGIRGILKPLVFLAGTLIYSKNKLSALCLFIPLILAAFLLGDSRVNMFCFFIFLYSALQVRNGFNIGILLTIVYFGLKNIFFVEQIVKYGNGFYL